MHGDPSVIQKIDIEHEGIGIELTFKAKQSHNSTFKLITLASIKR
jgi:hypothetical protein